MKKDADILLMLGKPKAKSKDSDLGLSSAQALIDAVKSGDAQAVYDAFAALSDYCEMGSEGED
jgi:hypothetical protein